MVVPGMDTVNLSIYIYKTFDKSELRLTVKRSFSQGYKIELIVYPLRIV